MQMCHVQSALAMLATWALLTLAAAGARLIRTMAPWLTDASQLTVLGTFPGQDTKMILGGRGEGRGAALEW